jgi:hypothetical protein
VADQGAEHEVLQHIAQEKLIEASVRGAACNDVNPSIGRVTRSLAR